MSGTRCKFWPEPGPIYYAPKKDLRLLRALWGQWRRQGLLEAYREAQERLREILRGRVEVHG
jgi:hypothetical protein